MKKYALIITLLLLSCSNNNNDTNVDDDKATSENNITEIHLNSFNLQVDGKEVEFEQNHLTRSRDYFELNVSKGNQTSISLFSLRFHLEENFGEIAYLESSSIESSQRYSSARYFAKSNFNFEVITVTENSISARFSGKLYVDDENIEHGVPIEISGDFNLPYTQVLPSGDEIRVKAKINTNNWFSTRSDIFNNTYSYFNDTQYRLDFDIDNTNIIVGDYTFNSESTGFNNIRFVEYSSSTDLIPTNYYIIRNGIFSIKSAEVIPDGIFETKKALEATFSFEAIHTETNEVIKVTSGILKGIIPIK